ncbi:hypothetical protein DU490_06635 [Halomonas sp. DQ26W]|nr:hypothetical protein DU490_06635 [Halomonas sp. DQ26W]
MICLSIDVMLVAILICEECVMGVKWFATALIVLGVGLTLFGFQTQNPAMFVGLTLAVLGVVVIFTGRRNRP